MGLRSSLDRAARVFGRAVRPARRGWSRGLPSEISFWHEFLTTDGMRWPETYQRRLDPTAEVEDPLLADCIRELADERIRVIDVGAGPLTSVGLVYPGRRLEVTAVDPLAEDYRRLLDELQITPPLATIPGSAEKLLEQFPSESFDIAYARNSLDHGIDPLRSIANMVKLVRPGGFVVLRHAVHEAVNQDYRGLHGWNIENRDGDLVVWRRTPRLARNVMRHVRDLAEGVCREEDYAVVAKFRRRESAGH